MQDIHQYLSAAENDVVRSMNKTADKEATSRSLDDIVESITELQMLFLDEIAPYTTIE